MKKNQNTWNYRILAIKDSTNEIIFEIHEVYYKNKIPKSYIANASIVLGDSKSYIKSVLKMMLKDIENKPILWAGEKFPEEYKSDDQHYLKTIKELNNDIKKKPLEFSFTAKDIRNLKKGKRI